MPSEIAVSTSPECLRRKGTGAALGSEQHRRRVLLRPSAFRAVFSEDG